MNIPYFFDKDDYLQNHIMRQFLKEHKLKLVDNRADYIKAIEDFANQNEDTKKETINWLSKIVKEGSKEICYKKINNFEKWRKNYKLIENTIKNTFVNCPMKNILAYKNTEKQTMIEYKIITNEKKEVIKIDFTYSILFLCGEQGELGEALTFPVFIEIYLDKGFIISREKAKSTLYQYNKNDYSLKKDKKINTMTYAVKIIDEIIKIFEFKTEDNNKIVKSEISQMLYKLYIQYSFTPKSVTEKISSQNFLIENFVDKIFSSLNLDIRNKPKAIIDMEIFVEKFISINGNNENIFKDRPAYLIKISADDDIELTKIDTVSDKDVPLQCTEAFFDCKKAIVKNKKCNHLNLIFKHRNNNNFQKTFLVKLGMHKNYGYVKTMQYAEEADIQNVLQAIFDNY